MEVVQQIGSDSFTPGHGVLISKTKTTSSSCGSSSCFVWVIDAHPADINKVDFVYPDGTPQMATVGDERQKNDASFNAGLGSGTSYEYTDTDNRLHFYILDKRTDAQGILHYTVGVKSLDGAGPQTRGVSLAAPQQGAAEGYTTCTFNLKNTGASAAVPAGTHPQDASAYLNNDIYRLDDQRQRHGVERVPQERAGHGEVRRDGQRPGLRREGHRRGLDRPDGHVGVRPEQVLHADLHVRRRLDRRRLRAGDARPDDGRPGQLRRASPPAWARTTSRPRPRTSSRPPVTRP